jgi:predicted NBD/HSP70 family sugar kinase
LERRAAELIAAGQASELARKVEEKTRRSAHEVGIAMPDPSPSRPQGFGSGTEGEIDWSLAQDVGRPVDLEDIRNALTGELIAAVAAEGDAVAQELLRETGRYVGLGLANLANLLDPERIIVGGGFSEIGPPLWQPALAALRQHAFRRPLLVATALGDWSGAFGAAAIAIEA